MAKLLLPGEIIAMDRRAADRLVAAGSGDGALLYLWLLSQGGVLTPSAARKALKWDDVRLGEAVAALKSLGLSDGAAAEEAPPPPAPAGPPDYTAADITRELEQGDSSFPALVNEVQRRLGKILSTADLKSLYTLYDYLALPAEVICLLVSWCVEEFERKYGAGRRPRMSQIQKEGFVWKRLGVDTVQAAEAHLKRQALYRTREGEVLRLLDIPPRPLVEGERKKVAAWTDMGFEDAVLRLAYEKTVYKKQKMDWDYMNGILAGWHRKNLHTLAEVEAGDGPRRKAQPAAMQAQPAAPGDADRRVREDLERMREFMRRQNQTKGE
ncbi:DnaD domain protein [Pseudoflavonifractor phocaeensis]|uniref:DnaD domain protein n=2 Tax=Eubacteriales TaxID=186802 RepID=UPI00174DA530|nr:DnaD domain protein [Flavonifractor sp. An306]MBM6886847.1 DnaD domain protein [Pseudoflavonifractor phocaeensis]